MCEEKFALLWFLGVVLICVAGAAGLAWIEMDKNSKCVELVNNPSLDVQKHAVIIEKFCR